jgi:uncharacterized protein involved in tolerance to divalent cations
MDQMLARPAMLSKSSVKKQNNIYVKLKTKQNKTKQKKKSQNIICKIHSYHIPPPNPQKELKKCM